MIVAKPLHRWNLSPAAAIRLQKRLAARVLQTPLRRPVRTVAGGDIAFSADGQRLVAAWVVWDLGALRIVDTALAQRAVRFPYVPGLLSFREAPALLAAARRLRAEPDAFLIDGQGRAHPRRFGLACHVGLLLERPTVGCGKSRLCGIHGPLGRAAGARQPLTDAGEVIGCVLRTRPGGSPVFVSVGHRVDLDGAVRVVLAAGAGYRLPEPARLAHQAATRAARSL